jgi:hypothetical protein
MRCNHIGVGLVAVREQLTDGAVPAPAPQGDEPFIQRLAHESVRKAEPGASRKLFDELRLECLPEHPDQRILVRPAHFGPPVEIDLVSNDGCHLQQSPYVAPETRQTSLDHLADECRHLDAVKVASRQPTSP